MRIPKITITGDLGSGKSVTSRLLQRETGLEIYSTGKIQRQIAAERGMSTLELNRYAETHPEIDDEIDGFSKKLSLSGKPFILDSRVAWFFVPESFKIFLRVDPEVAAARIMGDKTRQSESYVDLDSAKKLIMARKRSESERFKTMYGADVGDMTNFDLVVDTSNRTPEEVLGVIMEAYRPWLNQK